ncbi:MAG: cytochrome-c oxidase, cbb3-type subunit III [Pikeienuella sp.]
MSVKERDPLTGHMITGHEWNGIVELNTRVPRAVWFFIIVTHVWSLIIWVLLPAWPMVTTYTKGLLGLDQRVEVQEDITRANAARAEWVTRIADMPVADILADEAMMARVNDTAPTLFGDNCAVCHGAGAAGGPGFPDLTDNDWLWGGDPDTIMETLRVGINSPHPETRIAEMMAFGRDGILERKQVHTVTAYVRTLSGAGAPADDHEEGATLFADNCASCHGDDGTGMVEMGAPNLTDDIWIYGGDEEAVFQTVWGGRRGWMPNWDHRLSEADRKMLTVYLGELAGKATP